MKEGKTNVEELLHELEVHQAELTMQNEELRRAQEALAQSEARWRELFQAAPVAYLTVGADGLIQEANAAAVKLLGARPHLFGTALTRLAARADPVELHRIFDRALRHGECPETVLRLRGANGAESIPVELSLARLESVAGPLVLVVLRDLSERERAEEERLKLAHQIERLQRLEVLGRMGGAVSHEINNVLAVIMAAGVEASDRLVGSGGAEELAEVLRAARRGGELTQKLLGFARSTPTEQKLCDAEALVQEAAGFIRRLGRGLVTVSVVSDAHGATVRVDASLIQQALLNLGINAIDAIGDRGGHIELRLQRVEVEAARARPLQVMAGSYVRIVVSDSGPGFTPEASEHAFEPFFTTKPVGKGTGLGLATVWSVVRDHGGYAALESSRGQGGVVAIHLPLASDAVLPSARGPESAPAQNSGIVAMIVDDEPALRSLASRRLSRRGWKCVECASGPEALTFFRANGARVGVVLLDILMPGMSGIDVLVELRQIDATVPVVLVSGYSSERVPPALLASPLTAFLAKPYEPAELEETLTRLARRL